VVKRQLGGTSSQLMRNMEGPHSGKNNNMEGPHSGKNNSRRDLIPVNEQHEDLHPGFTESY